MNDLERFRTLLGFFKALGDKNRLRLVGLLLDHSYTVEELAALVNLSAPTVSHHLKRLAGIGLVSASTNGHYHVFSLRQEALTEMANRLLDGKELAETATFLNPESKTLRDFLVDGRLKTIPAQRSKRQIILKHLLKSFERGRVYTEREVNDLLKPFHEDVATLRREFIMNGLMTRANGQYRRTEPGGAARGTDHD